MLSLAIIAHDEKEQIERIVKDYGKYFDEIVVGVDKHFKVEGAKVFLYEPSGEEMDFGDKYETSPLFFDRKRNWLERKIQGDYYFRLDTDDTIEGVENIKPVYERAKQLDIDVVYCYYDYGKDVHGQTHAAHYRETLIKKSDKFYWNKHIHENIIPVEGYKLKPVEDNKIRIIHDVASQPDEDRTARNLKYLVDEYRKDGEDTDPRTLAYLGRTLATLDPERAKFFLEQHIAKSGWDEDRVLSWTYLSEVYTRLGDYKNAISCCFEALQDRPDLPDAYLKLHEIYCNNKQWDKAIKWGEFGLRVKPPKTLMLRDPAARTWRPYITMSLCLLQTNRVEEAYAFFKKAQELVPEHPWVRENENIFVQAIREKEFTKSFNQVYNFITEKKPDKALELLEMLPKEILKQDYFSALYMRHAPVKKWDDDSVVILCGKSPDEWSPLSIHKGIGGSEEAVIHLSKALQKQGKKVTVFNDCGNQEGVYSGVEYKDAFRFNPRDEYATLIAWRGNFFNAVDIKAKNKILWLHDTPRVDAFGKNNFDHVVVLSEYHKSLLPDSVPKDKVFVSTNGLVPKDYKKLKPNRKRGRIIYASSYDRGLEIILRNWPKIKKEVPYAELQIFYGWNTFDGLMEYRKNMSGIKQYLMRLMNQDGVHENGRVNHKQLLKEYCKSSVLAYPTTYVGEINCIALSKAIACGCRCVTNDQAVLAERNPDVVATTKEFPDKLIEVLKQENKNGIDLNYAEEMSWDNVAKDWIKNIL